MPPDPVTDSPPATSFSSPVIHSEPTTDPISVQAERQNGAGDHRSGLEGGCRSRSVPVAAKPAVPAAAATFDAHQAPISEIQGFSPPALEDPFSSREEASFEARGPARQPNANLRRRRLTLAPRRASVSSLAEATDSETRFQVRNIGVSVTGSDGADDEADADRNEGAAIAPKSDVEETIRMFDDADVLKILGGSVTEIQEINNAPSNYHINLNSGKGPKNGEIVLISNSPSGFADCVESAIHAGLTAHDAYDLAEETYHEAVLAGISTQEASDFVCEQRLGKAALLSTAKSPSTDNDIPEKLWIDIGFPKEKRWWENEVHPPVQDKTTSGTEALAMPAQREPKKQISTRPLGRTVPKRGIAIRPWKGPLPKPHSPTMVTLAAFMPPERINRSQSNLQHDQRTSQNSKVVSDCRSKSVLIERAKQYGRSWWDLLSRGPSDQRHHKASRYDATFPPIDSITSRPLLHAASRPDPTTAAAATPSYADMAGRQPPTNRHNSSGFNYEPPRGRISDRFRHDGRGLGPNRGRSDHGGPGRGRGDGHIHGRGNGRGGQ